MRKFDMARILGLARKYLATYCPRWDIHRFIADAERFGEADGSPGAFEDMAHWITKKIGREPTPDAVREVQQLVLQTAEWDRRNARRAVTVEAPPGVSVTVTFTDALFA